MINFKYYLNENIVPLAMENIAEFNGQWIYGFMEDGIASQLHHYALYLMCETITIGNGEVYTNPRAVVAKNEFAAVNLYNEVMNTESCTSLCELENRCDKVKVELD